MPEPTPPLSLETTALRYAARDLTDDETAAFETRLAGDQTAREALAEAVRLSVAALGREPLAPDRSFRALIRERARPLKAWYFGWISRRAYRGHPLAWAGIGATVVVAATLIGFQVAGAGGGPATPAPAGEAALTPVEQELLAVAPLPEASTPGDHTLVAVGEPVPTAPAADDMAVKAAEIWAELSTPDHVERAHDDEAKLRQRMRDLHMGHASPGRPAGFADSREP